MTRAADHIRVQALGVVILFAAVAGGADAARAQPATDFFAGRQVSVLIGTTAGGGYDVYARALARHIGRYLPGQPTVIPKNQPGAGGLTLANYVYNKAPAERSEFATVQNGLPFEKLFQTLSPEGRNALFDATKSAGSAASLDRFVTMTWHTSPGEDAQDATQQQAILGAAQ